ncbi:MAG: DUF2231 domain-containing protein [Chloroflexi bacterium]|nr:MAG: DUF2231 domain-containing protein [Chloroflexota bacterium]
MDGLSPEEYLKKIPNLDETSLNLSRSIHDGVLEGGTPLRKFVDLLHGTWLGHPLHPVLTDATIGAWACGTLLDMMSNMNRLRSVEKAADTLITLGVASAVPTALAGIADYTTVPKKAIATTAVHGLLNTAALIFYSISLLNRKTGNRSLGKVFSGVGLGTILLSAWLGGEIVYKYNIGANKTPHPKGPEDWTPVYDETQLAESQPVRIDVEGYPVMLYRYAGTVFATSAVCGHEGGPLEEGRFDGYCVECPWHQSVYDVRNGGVVHGPTTYALPSYATRISGGQIEIRLREAR